MTEWTPRENMELLSKVKEHGDKWTKISSFFPNRSPDGIRKHFAILIKKNFQDLNSNDDLNILFQESVDEKIQKILFKKIKYSEKISQLNPFDEETIFRNIIHVSINYPTFSSDISMFLKYIFDYHILDKKVFLNIASLHECKTLLLFCKTFSILEYDELNQISYIQDDQFFVRGPIFDFNDRNQIMKHARDVKKDNFENTVKDHQIENARLSKLVHSLNDQIAIQNKEIEIYQKRAKCLENIIEQYINNKKIDDKGVFVSNDVLQKYPILASMIQKAMYKTSDEKFYKFCSLIQMMNSKTYNKLKDFLPLISFSTCYEFTLPLKSSLIKMIENLNDIPQLIRQMYKGIIAFNDNNKVDKPIYANLAGDAASLKYSSDSPAFYAIQLLPFIKSIPPNVIHLMKTKNGASPPEVVNRIFEASKILNKMNILIKFISTDGDVSFDKFHRDFFELNVKALLNKPFEQIVEHFKDILGMPISDPFHLIKCARTRLLQHLMLIDPDQFTCINTALFSQAVELWPVFTDKSKYGAMKDMYPLALYSWYSFTKVVSKGRFESAYYILPFLLFIESIRSPLLSQKTRFSFIKYAFILFKKHLDIIHNIESNSVFKQRFSQNAIGVLFSDEIWLIRMLNTCIGLGVAILYHSEFLATQRISTHDIELFFGLIRCLSFQDNTYENAIRIVCESIIIKNYSRDLSSSVTIPKRVNEAGIVLTPEINSQKDLDFDCNLLIEVIYDLMKGNEVDEKKLRTLELMMDSYTQLIIDSNAYKTPHIPNLCRGSLPLHRYNIINYSMSVLPLPWSDSTFQFYMPNKKFSQKIEKKNIFQWCVRLCASIIGIEYKYQRKIKIPFQFDLNNPEDIEKVVDVLTNPLEKSENKEVNELLQYDQKENENKFEWYPITFLDAQKADTKQIDIKAQEILDNLKDLKKFNQILKSSENPKKLLKQAAKKSFILTLKKAMKIFLKIVNKMSKDEFQFKIKTNLTDELISPFKKSENDKEIPDKYHESITNFVIETKE